MATQKPSDEARAAIRASGMSQGEIARAVGVKSSVISQFVTGRRGLRLSTFDRLAEVLGLELRPASGRRPTSSPAKQPARKKKATKRSAGAAKRVARTKKGRRR